MSATEKTRGLVSLTLVRAILAQRDRCSYAPTQRGAITLALGVLLADGPMLAEAALRDADGYAQGCEAECSPGALCNDCAGGDATVEVAELLERFATEGTGESAADLAEHAATLLAGCAAATSGDLAETFNRLMWSVSAAMQRANAGGAA